MKPIAFPSGATTFGPDYLRLRDAVELPSRPQVLALTATATVDVQQDIVQQLGRPAMQPFVSGFDRPNLVYRVLPLNGQAAKLKALQQLLVAQLDGSTIVYTSTRRAAEEIAGVLKERGAEVLLYHCRPVRRSAPAGSGRLHGTAQCPDRGDQRLWHGDRQARRPVRGAL